MSKVSRVDTLLDLSPTDLLNMSRKDMARNISTLASAANKRLKRLETSGTYSPAAEYVKSHGGKFSVAGKNQNQLLTEFFRLQQFMESKTSSVKGAKKWQRNVRDTVADTIKQRTGARGQAGKQIEKEVREIFNDPDKKNQFWDLYSRLSNEYDVKENYKEIWDDIAGAMSADESSTTDDIFEYLTNRYEDKYMETSPQDLGEELRL